MRRGSGGDDAVVERTARTALDARGVEEMGPEDRPECGSGRSGMLETCGDVHGSRESGRFFGRVSRTSLSFTSMS